MTPPKKEQPPTKSIVVDLFYRYVWLGVSVAAVFIVLGFMGQLHWRFELLSHFRLQYAIALAAAIIIFACCRQWKKCAIAACICSIPCLTLLADYFPRPEAHSISTRFMLINVYTNNRNSAAVAEFIRTEKPAVVVLQEVNQRWWNELVPLHIDFPHRIHALRDDNFGIAVLSRFPLTNRSIERIDGIGVPSVICDIESDQGPLRLIATHPLPPGTASGAHDRNTQLSIVAEWTKQAPSSVIVLGDLNVTPWSPYFHKLLRETDLRDTRKGFGNHGSWPNLPPPFRIPIDHCLVSEDISTTNRFVGPAVGSDHRPVVIDLSVQPLKRHAQTHTKASDR